MRGKECVEKKVTDFRTLIMWRSKFNLENVNCFTLQTKVKE